MAEAPAIDLGLCGGSDESMALGMARSTDGATWTCASTEPILELADIPGSERVHSYALLAPHDAEPRLLVESLVGDRSELWLADLRTE